MINTHDLICMNCRRLMKKVKSGVKVSAESMAGYQVGDLMECPNCNWRLITAFGGERGPFNHDQGRLDYYFKKLV